MKEIEDTNLIELLRQALLFYANKKNYGNIRRNAPIDADEYGSQARFALKKVQETLDANKKLQEEYNKVIGETISAIENNPIDLTTTINSFKNIAKND
jgi:hypothetical protein